MRWAGSEAPGVRWARADRKVRGFSAPFEFDAFVFFGWPLAIPYYLWRTRGLRGLLLGLGVWILYLLPDLVSSVACLNCEE